MNTNFSYILEEFKDRIDIKQDRNLFSDSYTINLDSIPFQKSGNYFIPSPAKKLIDPSSMSSNRIKLSSKSIISELDFNNAVTKGLSMKKPKIVYNKLVNRLIIKLRRSRLSRRLTKETTEIKQFNLDRKKPIRNRK